MSIARCIVLLIIEQIIENAVNTLAAGLIQAVRKKQLIRTWLCG